jgi:hypothetical protein
MGIREHVFLLDPWWNPAVEAQAVDRTHRIGQARPVHLVAEQPERVGRPRPVAAAGLAAKPPMSG